MNRLDSKYFERIYQDEIDPWGFESTWYERRKYNLSLVALPRARYARAFEPGCANGALSELLAARCDELHCTELVPAVAARASARLQRFPHVAVAVAPIPDQWPGNGFDLVVLSEVVYYLDEQGVSQLLEQIDHGTTDDAHVLLVHYRGATDYPLSGDRCHALFEAHPNLRRLAHYEEQLFMLDVFERALP